MILEPNRFFHISCIENLFDLSELLDQGQLKMNGGTNKICGIVCGFQRFPSPVEESFQNKGSVFTIEEHNAYEQACETRETERSSLHITHCNTNGKGDKYDEQCSCAREIPEINKSDFFPEERTSRLLSQVLASLTEVLQIDGLSRRLLTTLKDMSAKEGAKLLESLVKANKEKRERNMTLPTTDSEVSGIDPTRTVEPAAASPA